MDERARVGFTRAEDYNSYRPGYPALAVAYIRETAQITERSCRSA